MAATSSIGFLVILAVLSGGPKELVSMIDAEIYFQQQGIACNEAEFLRILGKEGKDQETYLQKLLAIRELGKGKAQAAREKLQGLANDPDYFISKYAKTALARVDGKELPIPKTDWSEVLRSLPPDTQAVVGLDVARLPQADLTGELMKSLSPMLRMMGVGPGAPPADADAMMKEMMKRARRQMTGMALEGYKRVGNLEIQNVAFIVHQAGRGYGLAFWIRGVYDRERVREQLLREAKFRPEGHEWFLTNRAPQRHNWQEVVLGKQQVIIAPYCDDKDMTSPLIPMLRARRAGKPAPGCEKVLALLKKDVTDQMFWAAAVVPPILRQQMEKGPAPPPKIFAQNLQSLVITINDAKPATLTLTADLATAEACEQVGQMLGAQKQQTLAMIKKQSEKAPPPVKAMAEKAIAALEGIQIRGVEKILTIKVKLDANLVALPMLKARQAPRPPRRRQLQLK